MTEGSPTGRYASAGRPGRVRWMVPAEEAYVPVAGEYDSLAITLSSIALSKQDYVFTIHLCVFTLNHFDNKFSNNILLPQKNIYVSYYRD